MSTVFALSDAAAGIGVTLFVRGTAIVAVAALLATLLRPGSAATRHGLWTLAFVALAAAPPTSVLAPRWTLTAPVTGEPVQYPAKRAILSHARDRASATLLPSDTYDHEQGAPAVERVHESRVAATTSPYRVAASIAVAIWMVGVLVLLLRVCVHGARAAALVSRSEAVVTGRVAAALASRDARPARIVLSRETPIPMVCGLFRPTVVLPAAATDWPPGMLDSAVMHELAHVRRRDPLTHLLDQIVLALYWPNPLVRIAARRAHVERERACDDCVLATHPPHQYAEHLVEFARHIGQLPRPLHPSLALAAGSTLIERIRAILSPGLDRRPIVRTRLALAGVALTAVATPFATLHIATAPAPDPELVAALEDSSALVRQRAAWALGEFQSRAAVPPLLERIRDSDAAVRGVALWALGEIKDRRAVAQLTVVLDTDPDPLAREMAALALGEVGEPAAVAPLLEAARRQPDLRPAALWALGEIDHASATTAIRQLRHETPRVAPWIDDAEHLLPDARVRHVLGHIDSLAARSGAIAGLDALLAALRDPSREVRAVAVWALDEINPSRRSR